VNKKQRVSFKIILAIDNGFYNAGDKLPSLRDVAVEEGVSLYTALNAYNDLVSQGIIENRPKVGYFVPAIQSRDTEALLREYSKAVPVRQKANITYDEKIYEHYVAHAKLRHGDDCLQFSREDVNEEYFGSIVYDNFQKAARNTPATKTWKFFAETESKLASHIARWMLDYDCRFRKDHIVMMNNSVEAIMYAVRACYSPGKVLGIESPGHMSFAFCARFLALNYVELRCDPDSGLCVDSLVGAVDCGIEFFAILTSSSNSSPTGAIMPEENKRRLVEVCVKNTIPIIEYDGFGRLGYLQHRCNPIKSLEHESVIYISDFSKMFGVGVSLSFMECGKFTESMLFLKTLCGVRVPTDEQLAISINLMTDNISEHIKKLSTDINCSVELFSKTLKESVPRSVRIKAFRGGPFLWIEFPEGAVVKDFGLFAFQNNIHIAPGRLFSKLPEVSGYFRINCCSTKNPKRIVADAKALGKVITEFLGAWDKN